MVEDAHLSDEDEELIAEISRLDDLSGWRARQLLVPEAEAFAPLRFRRWMVAMMARARRDGFGKLEDAGASGETRRKLAEALESARNYAHLGQIVDPTWTSSDRIADVLDALTVALDAPGELARLHEAAAEVLSRAGRRPPSTQRDFLADVLARSGAWPRDEDVVLEKAIGMLVVVFEKGPAFGIPRTVAFCNAVPALQGRVERRLAGTKGFDAETGALKAHRVLWDVLVTVGMTDAEAETALRKVT